MCSLRIPWATALWPLRRLHKVPNRSFVRFFLANSIRHGWKLSPAKINHTKHLKLLCSYTINFPLPGNLLWLISQAVIFIFILVLGSVNIALLPDSLHHLAGKPAGDLASVMTAAVHIKGAWHSWEFHPFLGRLRNCNRGGKVVTTKCFDSSRESKCFDCLVLLCIIHNWTFNLKKMLMLKPCEYMLFTFSTILFWWHKRILASKVHRFMEFTPLQHFIFAYFWIYNKTLF